MGSFVRLLSFEGGKAKLAEVTSPVPWPRSARRSWSRLPRDSTVVAVIRHDHVVVPRDTILRGRRGLGARHPDSESEVREILTGEGRLATTPGAVCRRG